MYFCYPKQSCPAVAPIIAALACRPILPLTALQLQQLLHYLADEASESRFELNSARVRLDSSIELLNLCNGEHGWLQLVAPVAADLRQRRLSVLSPLGRTLLGQSADSVISLNLLGQKLRFRILTVLCVKHPKPRSAECFNLK
ncbi:GreA/GreB family elongation factor [Arsukibacterium indicum]|uniref:GreA/GreB family elongation factor n=1 Tax=Arsukibacterium indicum TaxID=2848612 RepID=A0ABS6MJH1_9GAMM|nr:GreA/GreB family elongation factor [Arsukibacterium indicum]MBV2128745.1 GreA/GreB family elongation factor [Arsukibacterium indicum]